MNLPLINTLSQVVMALASVAAALGVVAAYRQLSLVRLQLEDQRKWNKMSTAFLHPGRDAQIRDMLKDLEDSFLKLVSRQNPLTEAEVDTLMSDEQREVRRKLSSYLNEIECYCSAINHGVVDEGIAKSLYGYKFTRHYRELSPYISRYKTINNEPSIWAEFESVVVRWSTNRPSPNQY